MKKKISFLFIISLIIVCFINSGCSRKKKEKPVQTIESSSEALTEENTAAINSDVEKILSAIEKSSDMPSFKINTNVVLSLDGSLINGDYNMDSEIHIVQKDNHQDLEMTSLTHSDIEPKTAKAWYKDGWYYANDITGITKEQKSSEEILKMVTDTSSLVEDAADKIDEIKVSKDKDNTVYSFKIPSYLAENYLKQLTESTAAKKTDLANAKSYVEDLLLTSTISPDGLLIKQELYITGDIKKSIFKIPASANATAVFTHENNQSLDIDF